jgi:F0F1-type ATP synthase assembly protein I
MNNKPSSDSNKDLLKYAGLGTQLLVAIGLAVFLGIRLDKWLHIFPLLSVVFPVLVLSVIFYNLFRETGNKNQ